MKSLAHDSRSFLAADKASHAQGGRETESFSERESARREYQELVNRIDEVVREQEVRRRSGGR